MRLNGKAATPSLRNLWPKQPCAEAGEWHAFFTPGTPVLALPGWKQPRLLVPATSARDRWNASGAYPAFRSTAKLYRGLMRLRALSGIGTVRVSLADRAGPTLQEYLADTMPDAEAHAVMVGVAHQAQKLTVQLGAHDGTVVGYMKCASSPGARQRIRNEHLIQCGLPPGTGPRPLKYASMGGMDALLMEPVQGSSVRATLPPPNELPAFVSSLARPVRYSVLRHPWICGKNLEANAEVEPIIAELSAREWAVVLQHGDLVPWNLIRKAEGGLTALDWEYGCEEGFPGLDLAHYVLQVAAHIHRWAPARSREYATRYLLDTGLDVNATEANAVVRLTAYVAYQHAQLDGYGPDAPVQLWRRLVWGDTDGRRGPPSNDA
jgi:hypothetical protein